ASALAGGAGLAGAGAATTGAWPGTGPSVAVGAVLVAGGAVLLARRRRHAALAALPPRTASRGAAPEDD
ncbi:LPXTG cell wall anchor domain-containing protein, partial [Micromonospora chersina]